MEEMVSAGLLEKSAFATDVESIPSLKVNSMKFGTNAMAPKIVGACVSGVRSNTLFTPPGVPPIVAVEAIQLLASEHGSFGLINSKLYPPCFFISSLYQSSV